MRDMAAAAAAAAAAALGPHRWQEARCTTSAAPPRCHIPAAALARKPRKETQRLRAQQRRSSREAKVSRSKLVGESLAQSCEKNNTGENALCVRYLSVEVRRVLSLCAS